MLELDHVIIAVQDLDGAAERIYYEYGLRSVPGGRHPGHGTGNRIIPLGPDYIELMAVVDQEEAATSPLGRFVTSFLADGERPMAVCLRTDDIDSIAHRLGLESIPMSRVRPDGVELSWHLAGLERALGDERLPFFIEWHVDPAELPGRSSVDHRTSVDGLAWVEVGGDSIAVAATLGGEDVPIRHVAGPNGPKRVAVRTATGEVRL